LQKIENPNSKISPEITCQVSSPIEENEYDDPDKNIEKGGFQKGCNYETSPQTVENVYETLMQNGKVDTSTEPIYNDPNENSISEGKNWMTSQYHYYNHLFLRY
jgi:hypothetical protein